MSKAESSRNTDRRRTLRAFSMQAIYELEFYPAEETEAQLDLFLAAGEQETDGEEETSFPVLTEEEKQALKERILKILSIREELDRDIAAASASWKLGRMSRVDLAILRLALYELRYDDTVPVKVAINEAVDLAHLYGGDNSYQFVNGVLSVFAKEADE